MLKSIGLYFRKIDFLNFAVGAIMPIIVLFIVYSSVKSNIILQDTDFLSLLMNHKGKFIFYFFVSFIEEFIFRGIIFGLLLQKCKNKYLSCVIAALIFTLPHIFNTDNISVLVMFIFPFLYGIFANEMFYTTKSIWMPTGFHWLWNYTITSLFLVTGTQSFIYVHIIAAMIIMIPLFYIVIGKTRVEWLWQIRSFGGRKTGRHFWNPKLTAKYQYKRQYTNILQPNHNTFFSIFQSSHNIDMSDYTENSSSS